MKLILRNSDMKESKSLFSHTLQSSHVLAISLQCNNPFGILKQQKDLTQLDSISMANLNYGEKHNGIFIKITGNGQC